MQIVMHTFFLIPAPSRIQGPTYKDLLSADLTLTIYVNRWHCVDNRFGKKLIELLNNVVTESKKNEVTTKCKKTEYTFFYKEDSSVYNLTYRGCQFQASTEINYLGSIVTNVGMYKIDNPKECRNSERCLSETEQR